jgi:hypothetical protein
VDGARADHDEEARVRALQDPLDGVAARNDVASRGVGERKLVVQLLGRDQPDLARDVEVVDLRRAEHGSPYSARSRFRECNRKRERKSETPRIFNPGLYFDSVLNRGARHNATKSTAHERAYICSFKRRQMAAATQREAIA